MLIQARNQSQDPKAQQLQQRQVEPGSGRGHCGVVGNFKHIGRTLIAKLQVR